MENSHCCLSCSQSISQLQVKTKQETQRHFRVNGQQQLKRNDMQVLQSGIAQGITCPRHRQTLHSPTQVQPSSKADTGSAHLPCSPQHHHPASPRHQTMDDLQESRVTQLLASVSLLSSPEACYREKMYSGRQYQNKAEHIKADPMEPRSEEGRAANIPGSSEIQ